MSPSAPTGRRWAIDRWVLLAMIVGTVLRVLPHLIYGFGVAVRDEALYLRLAEDLLAGEGLGSHRGWLWAPAYPAFLALLDLIFPWPVQQVLPWVQGVLGGLQVGVVFLIGQRVGGAQVGRCAAWIVALHPTLIFFSGRAWSEGVYIPVLLGTVLAVLWAREGRAARGILPGVGLGALVLLRGVAQALPPFFVLAMLWPEGEEGWREALRRRWRGAVALGVATILCVAPYSWHASTTHGGLIVSDVTVGNLVYLGNNDFPPITFDVGNGVLRGAARRHHLREGRPKCTQENPVEWNRCELEGGRAWIKENPEEFVARIPLRVAQLLNPHGFLTRALRWGKYDPIPWWAKEGLILGGAGLSMALVLGGTLGAILRGRGPFAVMLWGVVGTTVLASAALYGMTRFRLPLEPLWAIYLATLLCQPRQTLAMAGRIRWGIAALLLPILGALTWRFFPSAWPGLFP